MPYKDINKRKECQRRMREKHYSQFHNLCKCGKEKYVNSEVCWDCHMKRSPDYNKVSYRKRYYEENKEEVLIQQRDSRILNIEKYQKREKEQRIKHVANLSDGYVRSRITYKSFLKAADIPQELVELYKLKLIAERILRNGTTNNERNESNSQTRD
jgi:hypothetical protein